jgi:hypothetical protein
MRSNAVIVSLSLGVSRNFSAFPSHRIMRNGANEKLHPEKPLTFDWRRQDLKKFRNTTKCTKFLPVRCTSARYRSRCSDCGFPHIQEIFSDGLHRATKWKNTTNTPNLYHPTIKNTHNLCTFRGYLRLNGRFCGPNGLRLEQPHDSLIMSVPNSCPASVAHYILPLSLRSYRYSVI